MVRFSSCPPMLNALPSRTPHTYALILLVLPSLAKTRFIRVLLWNLQGKFLRRSSTVTSKTHRFALHSGFAHYTGEEISFKKMLAFAKTVSLKATGSSIVKSNLFIIFGSKRGVGMFVWTNLSAQ